MLNALCALKINRKNIIAIVFFFIGFSIYNYNIFRYTKLSGKKFFFKFMN